MATKINYTKAYREKTKELKELQAKLESEIKFLDGRSTHYEKEFDKAVTSNRRYQEIILEQRGIIGFLEGKITKLTELLEEQ